MSERRTTLDWEQAKRRLRDSERALEACVYRQPGTPGRSVPATCPPTGAANGSGGQQRPRHPRPDVRAGRGTLRALEIADVVELLPFANVTPVPEGPPALLGVINLHEEIRSVVDLGRLMELAEGNTPQSGYVIVVRKRGRQEAPCVDALHAICPLRPEELLCPARSMGTPVVDMCADHAREGTGIVHGHDSRPSALRQRMNAVEAWA